MTVPRYESRDGRWAVEPIMILRPGATVSQRQYRITEFGFFVASPSTLAGVSALVPRLSLPDLTAALEAPHAIVPDDRAS